MASTGKVTLKSSDGDAFEVDEAVALKSQTIKHMIEDDCADGVIRLRNVTGRILTKVIEYCKRHVEAANPDEQTNKEDFVNVDQATLLDIILAADYLNIKSLLDLTFRTVADLIKRKTLEEIQNTLASKREITLKISDDETVTVDEAVALESQTIKHMIESANFIKVDQAMFFDLIVSRSIKHMINSVIPLPNITSKILAMVNKYCKMHVKAANPGEETTKADLKAWDVDFVKVDKATLFDLIRAANYLKINSLLDLTCQTVADMIKGKTPEEIRKTFNIKNESTPAEEEEVRQENQWAFEFE